MRRPLWLSRTRGPAAMRIQKLENPRPKRLVQGAPSVAMR